MDGDTLVIHTSEKPEKGMANRDIISQVARIYGIAQTNVTIIRGLKSRRKVLQLAGIDVKPVE